MIGYGFSEHADYEVYAKNGENPIAGRPSTDYIVNLDSIINGHQKVCSTLDGDKLDEVA